MSSATKRHLAILGTRGIPAKYGGFETFAEQLALYLVAEDWQVTVYCQLDAGEEISVRTWKNVRLVEIPVTTAGPLGTIVFDLKSTFHASRNQALILTLGYNTAIFSILYRLRGGFNIINMDGIEWRRVRWTLPVRAWFYLNEQIACWVGNHLIADHPLIKTRLSGKTSGKKITTIPYGAEKVNGVNEAFLRDYNLAADRYLLVVARPVPDNSILEIVQAYSQTETDLDLVILGNYDAKQDPYHDKVLAAANNKVRFLGAIYDKDVLKSLRAHALLYIHGHKVGGTNPSLVEALAAGNAVIAHDNGFNRWVAGKAAYYFKDIGECAENIRRLSNDTKAISEMRKASLQRYHESFELNVMLREYQSLLEKFSN